MPARGSRVPSIIRATSSGVWGIVTPGPPLDESLGAVDLHNVSSLLLLLRLLISGLTIVPCQETRLIGRAALRLNLSPWGSPTKMVDCA